MVEHAVRRLRQLWIATHVIYAPGEVARITPPDRIHGCARVATEGEAHRSRRLKRKARSRRNFRIDATSHRTRRCPNARQALLTGRARWPRRLRSPVHARCLTRARIELRWLRKLHAPRHRSLRPMSAARRRCRSWVFGRPHLGEQGLHRGIDQHHLTGRLARPRSVAREVIWVMCAGEAAPRRTNLLGGCAWRKAEHFVRASRPPPHLDRLAVDMG